MSLQFMTTRIEPDIFVVRLTGSLIPGPEGHVLEPLVPGLADRGGKKVIFDLGGVERIDSSGVQFLIQSFFTLRQAGGGLRLAGVPPQITRVFNIARLDSLVPIYPTVTAASTDFELSKGA